MLSNLSLRSMALVPGLVLLTSSLCLVAVRVVLLER
jgi:hypothetical protein